MLEQSQNISALFIELFHVQPTLTPQLSVSLNVRLQSLHGRPVNQVQVDVLQAQCLQWAKTGFTTLSTSVIFRSLCSRHFVHATRSIQSNMTCRI